MLVLIPFYALITVYATFNLYVFLFSWKNERVLPKKLSQTPEEAVTFLYTTYNDFNFDGFESILKAARPQDKILILDDSTDGEYRAEIDRIFLLNNCGLIRRPNRKGFKAGAINNALLTVDTPFVCIVDSDEVIPENYLSVTLSYFISNDIAFVQTTHHAKNTTTEWEKRMGQGVDLHWKIYQPYRNNHGVVNFLGHGAVLRTGAIKRVGGLPEIVAEDIGLTVELRMHGQRGIFVNEVSAGEEFPSNYSLFRKRHKKWTMGSTQFISKYFARVLFSKLKWYEKLDILIPAMSLPLTLILFGYIVLTLLVHDISSNILFAITLLAMITPNLEFIRLPNGSKALKTVALNALAYVSLFPTTIFYAIKGMFKPMFIVTGETATGKNTVSMQIAGDVTMGTFLIVTGRFSPLGMVCIFTWALFYIYGGEHSRKLHRSLPFRHIKHQPDHVSGTVMGKK